MIDAIPRASFDSVIRKVRAGDATVGIVGLGVSGRDVARGLLGVGIKADILESQGEAEFRSRNGASELAEDLLNQGCRVFWGARSFPPELRARQLDLFVVSPGVPLSSPLIQDISQSGIPVFAEMEFSLILANRPAVIITGSNGKTTTVTLIKHLFDHCKMPAILCGNIGATLISQMNSEEISHGLSDEIKALVVEGSSYQLESFHFYSPKVGGVLNLSENHLERHSTLARYAQAKFNVYRSQSGSDYALVNLDDLLIAGHLSELAGNRIEITMESAKVKSPNGIVIYNSPGNSAWLDVRVGGATGRIDLSHASLSGAHNLYNIAFAVATLVAFGVQDLSVLQSGIDSFSPLPHRIERFAEIEGRTFFNDSKSTSVAAVLAALKTVSSGRADSGVVLMLGGIRKKSDWGLIWNEVKDPSRFRVLTFGRDGQAISEDARGQGIDSLFIGAIRELPNRAIFSDYLSTLPLSFNRILFSPGCASFDEFSGFEERGEFFKSYVMSLYSH